VERLGDADQRGTQVVLELYLRTSNASGLTYRHLSRLLSGDQDVEARISYAGSAETR
jgi:hypothetical protein